jgi:hypothetical protein
MISASARPVMPIGGEETIQDSEHLQYLIADVITGKITCGVTEQSAGIICFRQQSRTDERRRQFAAKPRPTA